MNLRDLLKKLTEECPELDAEVFMSPSAEPCLYAINSVSVDEHGRILLEGE